MSHIAEEFGGLCCIKGCDDKVVAMGLCSKHWRRNKKYGSPVALAMPNAAYKGFPLIERFMMKIQKVESGCWIWKGAKDQDGYGSFRGLVGKVLYHRAHRWSIAHFKGLHPQPGENVCHTCDNPSCANPDHLYIGTVMENQRDKWKRGRGRVARGEGSGHAKITEDDVRAIRASTELQKVIAARYGLTQTTISDIKRRRSWAHID